MVTKIKTFIQGHFPCCRHVKALPVFTFLTEVSLWLQITLRVAWGPLRTCRGSQIFFLRLVATFTVFFSCVYMCVHAICVHPCLSSHVVSRQLLIIASTAVMSVLFHVP